MRCEKDSAGAGKVPGQCLWNAGWSKQRGRGQRARKQTREARLNSRGLTVWEIYYKVADTF